MGFLSKGKEKEKEFATLFDNVIYSDKEVDMTEHWDLMIDNVKYDVKGLKRVNRGDTHHNEFYHVLEIFNVHGKHGWVYGGADKFAFEINEYWVIVDKTKVQKLIKERVSKVLVKSMDEALYALYGRDGRKDRITLVKTIDLIIISDEIISKKIGIIEHVTGDSIYPEKRVLNKMRNLFK